MKSAAAIAFDYRPSRWLQAGLIGAVLLALFALAASGISTSTKAIAAVAALACAAVELRRLSKPRVARCAWHADGHWRVRDAAGSEHVAALLQASVHAGLIVLRLRLPAHGRVALVLLPDNCDAETRRQLRVRLAHAAPDVAA